MMTQQGFEDYLFAVYDSKNGTAKSYITAIHIIDNLFLNNDVFELGGTPLTCVNNPELLARISTYVLNQQSLFINGKDSFFQDINPRQVSYPGKRFCSAAMRQLVEYQKYDARESGMDVLVSGLRSGRAVSKKLIEFFDDDKEGTDVQVQTTARLGQNYFRRMVLANYDNRCCVTGLNIPQVLRASHIVAWAESKANRMNPENGMCLSATYDAAFDKHLISFDENYQMIVSRAIKEYYTKDAVREYFGNFEGKQIILPQKYLPNQKLLEKHRDCLVL